jgi:hypothetical protein
MPAIWRLTPRQSVAAECERRGKPAVVAGCTELAVSGRGRAAKHLRNMTAGRFTGRKQSVTIGETPPGDAEAQRRSREVVA